MNNFDSF